MYCEIIANDVYVIFLLNVGQMAEEKNSYEKRIHYKMNDESFLFSLKIYKGTGNEILFHFIFFHISNNNKNKLRVTNK